MMLRFYRVAGALGAPLIDSFLKKRLAAGKEDRQRFSERRGIAGIPRPRGPLIWIHGASVGEALSALPLIEHLKRERPKTNLLVTTGTVTSARLMADRLPEGAIHQYVPVDRLPFVRGFLDHWRPDLALWLESEFWPNLVSETAERRIPMILLNGRVSDRSFKGWKRMGGMIRKLLAGFHLCLGQTEEDARRLAALGAAKTACLGNIKFAVPALPADETELLRLAAMMGERPRWLAASTHAGEEAIAGRVHLELKAKFPDLLTVIVPRHPHRGPEIEVELMAAGLQVARRSQDRPILPTTDIYLADSMGELGLFFRLAPIVFIGKSLAGEGGQNPLEPARLDCALLFGPRMSNFAEMSRRMKAAGAAWEIADGGELRDAVARLLVDAGERKTRAAKARHFAEAESGVIDAVMNALGPYLDRAEGGADARP